MRELTIEQVGKDTAKFLKSARRERIVVTSKGRPVALVVGVTNYDAEDWAYMNDAAFWEMIRERRKSNKLIPFAQVMKNLEKREAAERQARAAKRVKSKGKSNGIA